VVDRTYVFIDGEYLRHRHREEMSRFFGVDGELELSPIMKHAGATRVYFYDAVDYSQGPAEDEATWEKRVVAREQFLASIGALSGFHVRPGSVRRGKKREQKEVDVLLAVDMMEHVLNGTMSKAILIAGDVDFRPVVGALVRHGIIVHVWYHSGSFAQELPGAADFGHEIRFRQLHSWNTEAFKRTYRVPKEENRAGDAWGDLVKVGSLNPRYSSRVRLYKSADGHEPVTFFLWIEINSWDRIMIYDTDLDLIERYVAVQYAPIQWEAKGDEIAVKAAV
jgi:uncharacterized LabA/DUF88 family protein